jgi:hypothetical protein
LTSLQLKMAEVVGVVSADAWAAPARLAVPATRAIAPTPAPARQSRLATVPRRARRDCMIIASYLATAQAWSLPGQAHPPT